MQVIGFFIMSYFLYIIQSDKDGTYYVGSTQDIEARLARHNQGRRACIIEKHVVESVKVRRSNIAGQ